MWKGMVFSLKVRLVIMNMMLNISGVWLMVLEMMVWKILFSFSVLLVVLYSIDMLYSRKLEVSVFRMKYFMLVLVEVVWLWCRVIRVYSDSDISFRFR